MQLQSEPEEEAPAAGSSMDMPAGWLPKPGFQLRMPFKLVKRKGALSGSKRSSSSSSSSSEAEAEAEAAPSNSSAAPAIFWGRQRYRLSQLRVLGAEAASSGSSALPASPAEGAMWFQWSPAPKGFKERLPPHPVAPKPKVAAALAAAASAASSSTA
jgi:hypothetical protein